MSETARAMFAGLLLVALTVPFFASPAHAAPAPPVLTFAEPLPSGAELRWTGEGEGFQIKYRPLGRGTGYQYRGVGKRNAYDLPGLVDGTRYEIRVRIKGRRIADTSSYSQPVYLTAGQRSTARCGIVLPASLVDQRFTALAGDRLPGLDRRGLPEGCNGYILGTGADGLSWTDVMVGDVGAVWEVTAPVRDLSIEGGHLVNTGFGVRVEDTGSIDGLIIRDVRSTGFSRNLAWIRNGRDALIERVTLDGGQYNDSGWAAGVRAETWTNLTVRDMTASNLLDDIPSRSFPQGEALDLGRGVTGVVAERITCTDVGDTCIDSKSKDLVATDIVSVRTNHGLRLWDDATITRHRSRDVGRTHAWAKGPDTVVIHHDVDWSDPDARTAVTWSENGAQHVIRSGTICKHPDAPFTHLLTTAPGSPERPTILAAEVTVTEGENCPRD